MTTAYTPILKLALPVTGELNGTWGDVVNNNITSMVEQAVAGLATINTWTANSHTLTTADGTTSESRCAMLVIDDDGAGNPSAAATVICPTATKSYIVRNLCGQTVTVKTAAGTGVAVPNNQAALVFCDGTNVVTGAFNGDVVGPATSTNNAIVTFDGTTGKLIKDNSGVTISAGVITATGVSAGQVDITAQGDLRLQDTTGGEYVALQAPSTIATSYTLTLPVDDGAAGQALITDGSGVLSWSSAASGDVYGPASATDNAVARYDGTTGKIIQNSAVTIADDGATVIAANSSSDGLRITQTGAGNALVVEDSANPDSTPFVVDSSGRVGIGGNPSVTLETFSDTTNWIRNQSAGIPIFAGYKANGTIASKTIVASGDEVSRFDARGYDGANFVQLAQIGAFVDGTPGTNDMPGRLVFSTTADGASSPTERMRIDSAGNVGIGASSVGFARINLFGTAAQSFGLSYGFRNSTSVANASVTTYIGDVSELTTQATSWTLSNLIHYSASPQAFGAGSTVTNQIGFRADSSLTGATNNYGFYSNIASGTGRWNFYAAGTADNYFAGNVGIGVAPAKTVDVNGQLRVRNGGATGYGLIEYGASATATNNWHAGSEGDGTFRWYNGTFGAGSQRGGISSAGVWSLGAAPGAESLRVTPVASAVNYVEIRGQATTGSPQIYAKGSDTNIFLEYYSKGTGNHLFYTNGEFPSRLQQFVIAHTASAVNYLQVTGSATGNATSISAAGSDTNIDLTLTPKGSGYVVVDAAYSPNLTLTDAATITWDTSTAGGQVATFTFVSSNRTMGAPTNLKNGGFYALAVIQNAGSNTLTWNAVFKWAGGTAPTLSTAAGAKDYFVFRSDGTSLFQQGISQAVA